MDCRKGRRGFTSATTMALLCCSLIALFSISSLWSSSRADLGNPTSTPRIQGAAGRRRGLSGSGCGSGSGGRGPGSYPPLCAAKCGECTPCNPVHEAVRPGQPAVEEYYPEAWRCKCGNKLYMPWPTPPLPDSKLFQISLTRSGATTRLEQSSVDAMIEGDRAKLVFFGGGN